MHTEEEIRRKVRKLQQFYMNLLVFVGVNVLFSLIWLTSSRGTPFWPKYIIIVWGAVLMAKAYKMRIFTDYIPFLTPEWEKSKVQELMVQEKKSPADKKKAPLKKAAPTKKVASPKKEIPPKKGAPAKSKPKAAPKSKKKA